MGSTGQCRIHSQVIRSSLPQCAGIQQSENISTGGSNKWQFLNYTELPYIRLPKKYRRRGQGGCEVTISQEDSPSYITDIQTPGEWPDYLFVTLNRFDPKNMKTNSRSLTPGNFPSGGKEYYQAPPLQHGRPKTDSGHY